MIVYNSHVICLKYCLSVQKLGNPKLSIVYCSASNINNNICDTVPLDNSSNIVQIKPALQYITWGLSSGIPKLRQEDRNPIQQVHKSLDCYPGSPN